MTCESSDPRTCSGDDGEPVAREYVMLEDLSAYITDDPDDWNEFWDSEPFEKWRRGGPEWR